MLMSTTRGYDEIIGVFDTYKDSSLKYATRESRRQGKAPVQYKIHDDTQIKHVTMKKFLSHNKTKSDLTDYLAMKVMIYNKDSPKLIVVSASGCTRSNSNIVFENNNHKEADTFRSIMQCWHLTEIHLMQKSCSSHQTLMCLYL